MSDPGLAGTQPATNPRRGIRLHVVTTFDARRMSDELELLGRGA